jgi:predicted kinase
VTRLIHLNGPPGVGKSTLAPRYVAAHPGVLNCDIDVLRSLIGGWQDDFDGAGGSIRPAALAMIEAYLATGRDVVLPQMLADPAEVARFEGAASAAGADFVERFLMDTREATVARFHRRGAFDAQDPWHDQVREIVAGEGGDERLLHCHEALTRLIADRPRAVVIMSTDGDVGETYRALIESFD